MNWRKIFITDPADAICANQENSSFFLRSEEVENIITGEALLLVAMAV